MKTYQARFPTLLAASTSGSSAWIPILGARCIVVHWQATDTDTLSAVGFDVSVGGATSTVNFNGATRGTEIIMTQTTPSVVANRMDQGGMISVLTPPVANRHMVQPWNYMRLTFTAGIADIDNFEIEVDVYHDRDYKALVQVG